MKRGTLALIAVSLIVVAFGPSGESEARGPGKGRLPGISLQRVGTIGDYPAAGRTTIVNVNAGGILIVDGREVLIVIVSENTATGMPDLMAICTEGAGVMSVFKHFAEAEWGASSPYFSESKCG